VKLIGRDKLKRIGGEADRWLRSWCAEVVHAHWRRPEDVINQFPNACARPEGDFFFPVGASGYSVRLKIAFLQGVALILDMNKNDLPYGR
jgi:mRNA-degrading endonuclease HigB of HigAB toxin-antitoxin module